MWFFRTYDSRLDVVYQRLKIEGGALPVRWLGRYGDESAAQGTEECGDQLDAGWQQEEDSIPRVRYASEARSPALSFSPERAVGELDILALPIGQEHVGGAIWLIARSVTQQIHQVGVATRS